MIIRKYVSTDCKQVADLFYETVHSVNAKDYTIEQLDAWADGSADLEKWDKSFIENYTLVAVEDNCIVGFGDIDRTGYLDMLFVHKDFQGQGIASAICDRLEASITTDKIATHASITAKPFFEKRGYKSVKEQQIIRKGIRLTNYVMGKQQQQQPVAWLP